MGGGEGSYYLLVEVARGILFILGPSILLVKDVYAVLFWEGVHFIGGDLLSLEGWAIFLGGIL